VGNLGIARGSKPRAIFVRLLLVNTASRPRILFAEDNIDHAFLVQRVLEPLCELHHASDGEQALEKLRAWEGELPRLVLIDVNLPRLSGLEVLERIRADNRYRAIPLVVFSTSRLTQELARAYMSGANSFVVKPPHFQDFREVLLKVLEYWTRVNAPLEA
jgi:two-component system, response regulator